MCPRGPMSWYQFIMCVQQNQSADSMTHDKSHPDDNDWQRHLEAIFICLVAVVGFSGNLFVLVDSNRLTRFMQENVYLFFSMSLCDIITCVVRCAAWVYILYHMEDDSGSIVCEIWLASSVFIAISMVTNMIIAIERYLIMYSYKTYRKVFTAKKTLLLLILVWILLAIVGTFLDKGFQFEASFHDNRVSCVLTSTFVSMDKVGALIMRTATALLLGVGPIVTSVTCYVAIVRKICKADLTRLKEYDETVHFSRIIYISMSRVALMTICWLPYLFFVSVGPLDSKVYYDYMRFFDYMLLFQAVLSPFITMHDTDFRDTAFIFDWKACFSCTRRCQKSPPKLQREGTKTSRTSFRGRKSSTSIATPMASIK